MVFVYNSYWCTFINYLTPSTSLDCYQAVNRQHTGKRSNIDCHGSLFVQRDVGWPQVKLTRTYACRAIPTSEEMQKRGCSFCTNSALCVLHSDFVCVWGYEHPLFFLVHLRFSKNLERKLTRHLHCKLSLIYNTEEAQTWLEKENIICLKSTLIGILNITHDR